MSVCPNCGAPNEEVAKFCINCGGPLQTAQPVSQAQNDQFIPITPTNPLPSYTPIQPVYAQPITQPVQKRQAGPKSNGFCTAGLVFSLVGLGTLGLTCPLGFLLSLIGFFSASMKRQPGKGKAITGMIVSGVVILSLAVTFSMIWDDIRKEVESGRISNPMDFIQAIDEADERTHSSYQAKVKEVTSVNWVSQEDGSNLVFGNNKSFRYYKSYKDDQDNYYTGKYRIYVGTDAIDMTARYYSKYVTKDEINRMISQNSAFKRENYVLVILENDGMWMGGKNVKDEKWESVYYGFNVTGQKTVSSLLLINMSSDTRFSFIPKEDYLKIANSAAS